MSDRTLHEIEADLLSILNYLNDTFDGSRRGVKVGEALGRISDDLIDGKQGCADCGVPIDVMKDEEHLVRVADDKWISVCAMCWKY